VIVWPPKRLVPIFALLLAPAWLACSLNPLTQKPEVVFVSEADEVAAGKEASAAVAEQMGLVTDPSLVAYVQAIGERVAVHAPSETLTFRFAVVDLDEPNAFALPGGWVYVSRGILELANSEDELANVIAHEVVHVAARHHAQRHARQTGVGILALPGLLAGALIPGVGGLVAAPFAAAGAGVLAGYSRDQERESDRIGQQMAAQAGYDPAALGSFLASLERDTTLRVKEPQTPSWLDTHPSTGSRAEDSAKHAEGLAFSPQPAVAGSREGFLNRLDGLLVGENPAEGLFEGQRFLHPDLGLTLVFPDGWKTANARDAVGAVSEKRDAQLMLRHAGEGKDPREAASLFFEEVSRQTRIDVARLDSLEVNGLSAVRGQAVAAGGRGSVSLDLTWIALGGSIYQLTGVVDKGYTDAHRASFGKVVHSFRRLTPAERDGIREMRLRVAAARDAEGIAGFGSRAGNAWSVDQTAVANGLQDNARLSDGQLLKVAVKQPYRGR
jgi:predicted Zn-dependent protease